MNRQKSIQKSKQFKKVNNPQTKKKNFLVGG